MRHFRKPLAGMVICGSGPNLSIELNAHDTSLVFLIQICSIILPIRVVAFSHPHYPTSGMFCGTLIMHAPELDSLHLLSVRPKSSAPSCRSEEHTSELQSLMRISYAVFCLKK